MFYQLSQREADEVKGNGRFDLELCGEARRREGFSSFSFFINAHVCFVAKIL